LRPDRRRRLQRQESCPSMNQCPYCRARATSHIISLPVVSSRPSSRRASRAVTWQPRKHIQPATCSAHHHEFSNNPARPAKPRRASPTPG
jgi:hypothetical protein